MPPRNLPDGNICKSTLARKERMKRIFALFFLVFFLLQGTSRACCFLNLGEKAKDKSEANAKDEGMKNGGGNYDERSSLWKQGQ